MREISIRLLRAFAVASGIVLICHAFPERWEITADALIRGKVWIARYFWPLLGTAIVACGLFWQKILEWGRWIWSMTGPAAHRLGLLAFAIGMLAICARALALNSYGPVVCFLPLWIAVACVVHPRKAAAKPMEDFYHRTHLVERLADLLHDTPENVRRIGILAEWGEGKSHVLKLLEDHFLQRTGLKKFRMAWVNPWRADSGEKAWEAIARGVDEALGFRRLLPKSLLDLPAVGSLLEMLPKWITGLTGDLKTLFTREGSVSDKIALGLKEYLESRNEWLLLLVDDMERVGHEELKKIFPVIDRLEDLERCYFVFAIDPKRVAKVFGEKNEHDEQTKGYLDKILDLQLMLPETTKDEASDMLDRKIDKEDCPKLAAALPALRDYLPLNPRLADRFLRDAEARERMFLSRLGPEEENYEVFFLLLLVEIRFPKVFKEIKRNTNWLEAVDRKTLADLMPESAPEDLEEAYAIVVMVRYLHGMDDFQFRSNPLTWALSDYRKLVAWIPKDREHFITTWRSRAGEAPLEILFGAYRKYYKPEILIRKALEEELSSIWVLFHKTLHAPPEDQEVQREAKRQVIARLNCFIRHLQVIVRRQGSFTPSLLDRKVFGHELAKAWRNQVQRPLASDAIISDSTFAEVTAARQNLARLLIRFLEPKEKYDFAESDDLRIRPNGDPADEPRLRSDLSPVFASVLEDFSREFIQAMRQQSFTDVFPPHLMTKDGPRVLHHPGMWLPLNRRTAIETLEGLAREAASNQDLEGNFKLILEKLPCLPLMNIDGPDELIRGRFQLRKYFRESARDYPWYLLNCWKGAYPRRSPEAIDLKNKLVETERKALEEGTFENDSDEPFSVLEVMKSLPIP